MDLVWREKMESDSTRDLMRDLENRKQASCFEEIVEVSEENDPLSLGHSSADLEAVQQKLSVGSRTPVGGQEQGGDTGPVLAKQDNPDREPREPTETREGNRPGLRTRFKLTDSVRSGAQAADRGQGRHFSPQFDKFKQYQPNFSDEKTNFNLRQDEEDSQVLRHSHQAPPPQKHPHRPFDFSPQEQLRRTRQKPYPSCLFVNGSAPLVRKEAPARKGHPWLKRDSFNRNQFASEPAVPRNEALLSHSFFREVLKTKTNKAETKGSAEKHNSRQSKKRGESGGQPRGEQAVAEQKASSQNGVKKRDQTESRICSDMLSGLMRVGHNQGNCEGNTKHLQGWNIKNAHSLDYQRRGIEEG